MTKPGILAAAALLASTLASPVMAQQVVQGPNNTYTTSNHQSRVAYRHNGNTTNRGWHDSYNRWDGDRRNDRDSGFWPADVAAGVVGGAVGTAAAIATAPFGGEPYARPMGGDAYARQNGFVCTPGAWFRGEDGRRHICQ
jgi:hypothetical protein